MSVNTIRIPEKTKSRLRAIADEQELTFSEALLAVLPDDAERPLDRGSDDFITVSDEAYKRLKSLSGEGVDQAETIAYFLERYEEPDHPDNHPKVP